MNLNRSVCATLRYAGLTFHTTAISSSSDDQVVVVVTTSMEVYGRGCHIERDEEGRIWWRTHNGLWGGGRNDTVVPGVDADDWEWTADGCDGEAIVVDTQTREALVAAEKELRVKHERDLSIIVDLLASKGYPVRRDGDHAVVFGPRLPRSGRRKL